MHGMVLLQTFPTGAQDWLCPHCGRRFVLQQNSIKRVILVEGDSTMTHAGGTGGLQMGRVEIEKNEPLDLSAWENGL